jgi:hypothetical protein
METKAHYTRRDDRHPVPPGVGFVELYADDTLLRAELVRVSVAGMTLELSSESDFPRDKPLVRGVVRVGACQVQGELLVKYAVRGSHGRTELGCLFYPATVLAGEKWSAMVTVFEAAAGT